MTWKMWILLILTMALLHMFVKSIGVYKFNADTYSNAGPIQTWRAIPY